MSVEFGGISEADWEASVLDSLAEQGWIPMQGREIAPGTGERESWQDIVLPARLLDALRRCNPSVPVEYLKQAAHEITRTVSNDALTENRRTHVFLTEGSTITHAVSIYTSDSGSLGDLNLYACDESDILPSDGVSLSWASRSGLSQMRRP